MARHRTPRVVLPLSSAILRACFEVLSTKGDDCLLRIAFTRPSPWCNNSERWGLILWAQSKKIVSVGVMALNIPPRKDQKVCQEGSSKWQVQPTTQEWWPLDGWTTDLCISSLLMSLQNWRQFKDVRRMEILPQCHAPRWWSSIRRIWVVSTNMISCVCSRTRCSWRQGIQSYLYIYVCFIYIYAII